MNNNREYEDQMFRGTQWIPIIRFSGPWESMDLNEPRPERVLALWPYRQNEEFGRKRIKISDRETGGK
jgi:hypothetical protein